MAAACSAGSRGLAAPDHAISLSSAFLLHSAGVITPMFDVQDTATALVMAKFYRIWLEDDSEAYRDDPAAALRAAQIEFLDAARAGTVVEELPGVAGVMRGGASRPVPGRGAGRDFANPFYWAGLNFAGV